MVIGLEGSSAGVEFWKKLFEACNGRGGGRLLNMLFDGEAEVSEII